MRTKTPYLRIMLATLRMAARDRARLAELGATLSRHGLGYLGARLGLGTSGTDDELDSPNAPRRLRRALEELGPTYIKFGQILATRTDLLGPKWIAELELLQSDAPTLPFALLRSVVEQALGEPVTSAFAQFEEEPLAAASMAQVHRARLTSGEDVVVKVRRPDIRPRMEADLRILTELAAVAERASADLRHFRPVAMITQLSEALLQELDFTVEARNADTLRADFARDSRVVVPCIHWSHTSESLLVMDYIDGIAPLSGDVLRAAGIDTVAIASLGADVVLDMVLINGRFHADPHPGNLRCLEGNRLALLDLGLVGHVSPRRREEFVSFTQALLSSDSDALADVLMAWAAGGDASPDAVRLAAEGLIARHGGHGLILSALMADFMPLLRERGLVMPPDLILIFKALVTMDGVLMRIEPEFDLSAAIQRSTIRLAAARLGPDHWQPILRALAWELAKIGDSAPQLVRAAAKRLSDTPPSDSVALRAQNQASRALVRALWGGSSLIAAAILAARFL